MYSVLRRAYDAAYSNRDGQGLCVECELRMMCNIPPWVRGKMAWRSHGKVRKSPHGLVPARSYVILRVSVCLCVCVYVQARGGCPAEYTRHPAQRRAGPALRRELLPAGCVPGKRTYHMHVAVYLCLLLCTW